MSSLTLLDQGEFSDVFVQNLHVDNVFSDQSGQTTFNDPVFIGNDSLEQHIRNQISVTGALTYNNSTGLIRGITIDNVGHNVTLSISGDTILSADVGSAIQSKWELDITGNVLYPSVAVTGIVAVNDLVVSGGATINSGLTVSGNIGLSGAMTISGTLNVSGNVNITGSVSFNNGISVSGNATFNNNVFINLAGGIGVGEQPLGGAHRLNTRGRIRATAFDIADSSGVIETVSNGGYINYLYTAETGKSYYDGTTDGLNVQIGLSANSNFQVAGSSVHNAGIYVVGGSEINGGLKIQSGMNVTGSSSFNNALTVFGELRAHEGLFVTGIGGQTNRIYSGGLTVTGSASFNNGLTITGGGLSVIGITALGDITLGRNNSATVGRLITISFGTGNAGAQAQGIEFRDLTTPASNLGMYGSQNTLRFYSGGTEKMAIGANVDFATAPYVGGDQINTTDVLEVGNLYFTQTRARQSISAVSPIVYDNSTGVISLASSNINYEWKYSAPNTSTPDTYLFIARMDTGSGGDAGLQIRGLVGGYFGTQVAKVDIAINTRGANTVYGSMETQVATLATVIGFMDIVMYSNGTFRDIYIYQKTGVFYSYDLILNGSPNGVILQTPTTTPTTPVGTVAIASILSNLRVYTIAGQVNIGTSVAETNVLLNVRKASGGIKAKVETASGNDAELWLKNSVSSFAWYANGSVNSMRLYNYGTSADLMTILSDGKVGIGLTNPTHSLVVNGSQILSGANKSLWLGGETGLGNDGSRFHFAGDGNTYYDCKSSTPNFVWRSNTTDGATERMRLSNAGNLGVGTASPSFRLDLQQATDTTARIKSNSTTGYAQVFVQADGVAGGGLYLNGSAGVAEGGANTLVIKNNMGGVLIRNNGLTGGICITGNTVGNVGINNVNPTYTLDIIDNRPPLSIETTTEYSNNNIVVDSSGFGIFPREFVTANIANNIDGLGISGGITYVNFSSANEDGSFYFTGTASGYVGINGGVGVAVWNDTSNLQFDFSIYVKQINGSANNWIVRCGTAGIIQGIFLNNSRRLQITNGTATAGSTTTLALNTWYRVTAYCNTNPANNQVTLIINGATETLSLAGNSTVWTLHQLGINTTAGFIFYLNNYRLIKGVTSAVQDANPLSLRGSPVTNYALVRAAKTFTDASISRGGNFLTSLGNFNGSQLKVWRLLEIVGPSPATAAYAVNSGRFRKTSADEKLLLHYIFSSYSNVAGSIWTTYFYIHRADGSYTGFFDTNENQWYGAANTLRLYSSGVCVLPDALPAGNYYIRFANAAQLTMDTNDRLRLYLQQGVSGA